MSSRNDKVEAFKALALLVTYDRDTGIIHRNACGREFGTMTSYGYISAHVVHDGKEVSVPVHRLAWFIVHGKMPHGDIDHINGIRHDNRLSNLRDVSRSMNSRNAVRRSDNKSGLTGTYWDKQKCKWRLQIRIEGKLHHLGYFRDIEAAKAVAREFRAANGFTERHGTVGGRI